MNAHLSTESYEKLSTTLSNQIGIHFPFTRKEDLERGLNKARSEFGFDDIHEFSDWITDSKLSRPQIEILASHLTVGETYFFREKQSFEILEGTILPSIINTRRDGERRIRIWSAGCCTGEEPYSIAISVYKCLPDIKNWNVTILATDINPHFLQKAAEGIYGDWSFREMPQAFKDKYFKKLKSNRYEILPRIKKLVTFAYLNLAEDVYPSLLNNTNAIDVIFCRNVLMYFSADCAKRVSRNFYKSLIDGGWLIVSPSETSHILFSDLTHINFPNAILYKKDISKHRIHFVSDAFISDSTNHIHRELSELSRDSISRKDWDKLFPSTHEHFPANNVDPSSAEPMDQFFRRQITHDKDRADLQEQREYKISTDSSAVEAKNKNNTDEQEDIQNLISLARLRADEGLLKQADDLCKKAIAVNKLNPECYFLLATIRQEQGATEDAINLLKRALYLDQEFVIAHFALGNLIRRQGKFEESEKYFHNAFMLLHKYPIDEILPGSDGINARRLAEIITTMTERRIHGNQKL